MYDQKQFDVKNNFNVFKTYTCGTSDPMIFILASLSIKRTNYERYFIEDNQTVRSQFCY